MAPHAYRSLEPGAQIVVSDEPREDLEALARWESIPIPEEQETTIPDGDPTDKWSVAELKAYAAREGIELAGAKNKPEYLKAIADRPKTPAGANDAGEGADTPPAGTTPAAQ